MVSGMTRWSACLFVVSLVACEPPDGAGLDMERKPAPPTDADAGAPAAEPANQAPAPFACDPGKPGPTGDREIVVAGADGKERTVLLHVPTSYDPTKGVPLILGFHGYGGNAEQMREQTGFDAEADKRGFVVAYVLGTGIASKGFNAGDCCGAPAWTSDTDDLGLARQIVTTLSAQYCVDPKRVFNAGFSNGGFMSYRLACEASDVFAAVASVSGVLGVEPEACKPERPVPLIHIHGTRDRTVPYEGGGAAGGLGTLAGIRFRSVADSVATFRQLGECDEASSEVLTAGDTRCEEWKGCKAGARYELCTVTDGGHQWPGGKATPVGGKRSDFAATKTILDFFEAHPMP